jgi:hypothetical protein
MNADVEPVAKHAPCSALRPLRRVRGPAEEPMLKKEGEVLGDEGVDLVDGIELGAEEDGEFVVCLGDLEPRPIVVEGVGPIGVRLLRDQDDRGPIEACDEILQVAS